MSDSDGNQGDRSREELAAFDAQLAQALGTHSEEKELTADLPSSSDEDMDDEQMEKLDEHLECIFRERKKDTSKKNEQKDAKETIINFKCRVLELLDVLVRNEHKKAQSLSILMPVLRLTRTTDSPLVSRKACDLVRQFSQKCKGSGLTKAPDTGSTMALLKAIHEESGKGGSNNHASACSQASLQVVRVLAAHDRELLRQVVALYASTQESFLMDSTSQIKASLFTDWLNWCSNHKH